MNSRNVFLTVLDVVGGQQDYVLMMVLSWVIHSWFLASPLEQGRKQDLL